MQHQRPRPGHPTTTTGTIPADHTTTTRLADLTAVLPVQTQHYNTTLPRLNFNLSLWYNTTLSPQLRQQMRYHAASAATSRPRNTNHWSRYYNTGFATTTTHFAPYALHWHAHPYGRHAHWHQRRRRAHPQRRHAHTHRRYAHLHRRRAHPYSHRRHARWLNNNSPFWYTHSAATCGDLQRSRNIQLARDAILW